MNLWGHVIESSEFGRQVATAILSFDWSCKAEVSDLDIELGVEQDILRFQISMCNAHVVAVVQALHKLFKVVSGNWFLKSSGVCNKVKQLSTTGEFKHYVRNLFCFSTQLHIVSCSVLNLINYVLVFELRHGLHLGHN